MLPEHLRITLITHHKLASRLSQLKLAAAAAAATNASAGTVTMEQLLQRLDNTSTPTDVLDPRTRAEVHLFGIWFEMVLCVMVVLNSALPVIALLRYQNIRRHNMYIFLAGMATSDICVGVTTLASTVLNRVSAPLPPVVCVALAYCRLAASSASMLGLLALTADRCVAVLHPLRHRVHMSARRARRLAPLCWAAGALQALILAAVLTRPSSMPKRGVCDVFSALQPMAMVVTAFSTDLIVLLIVSLNVAVICTALHHRRRLLADRQHPAKARRRTTRSVHLHSYAAVLKLVLLFLVLVLPFQVALHVYLFVPGHGAALWFVITGLMRQCYHVFNGWVFGVWCAQLRRVYLHLLCCRPLYKPDTSLSLLTIRRSGELPSQASHPAVRPVRAMLSARHSVDHGVIQALAIDRSARRKFSM